MGFASYGKMQSGIIATVNVKPGNLDLNSSGFLVVCFWPLGDLFEWSLVLYLGALGGSVG